MRDCLWKLPSLPIDSTPLDHQTYLMTVACEVTTAVNNGCQPTRRPSAWTPRSPLRIPTATKEVKPTAKELKNTAIATLEKEGKDMNIKCRTCNDEFKHTVAEQIRFKERGWEYYPARCAKCRDKDPPRPCFDFNEGKCKYGDQCKFLHEKADHSTHFT